MWQNTNMKVRNYDNIYIMASGFIASGITVF